MKTFLKITPMFFLILLLVACSSKPSAIIRAIDIQETQLTFTLIMEDEKTLVESFNVQFQDAEGNVLEPDITGSKIVSTSGEWSVTFPIDTYQAGTYYIVVIATYTFENTFYEDAELAKESVELP